MKTFLKYAVLISAITLAAVTPLLWNCADYSPDYSRYWLLDPNITNTRELLPFTYCAEIYYNYGWNTIDTGYQVENVQSWKAMTGGTASESDIHQILYYTTPEFYFNKAFPAQNSFITALKKPANANHLRYLNFAKQCEGIFYTNAWEENQTKKPGESIIAEGQACLTDFEKEPALQRRTAYQLMKLYQATNAPEKAREIFKSYFEPKPKADWLQAAALYLRAEVARDSVQSNIWLARAWEARFYQPIWIWHSFRRNNAFEASIKAAANGRDKANLVIIPASREAGPALQHLQRAYDFDPSAPGIAHLMAREVNKLENWLLSPVVYGEHIRVEVPYTDSPSNVDTAAMEQKDRQHLKATLAFAQKVIGEKKRNDIGFWYLSAAHLAYLDRDFKKAMELAAQGQQMSNLPANQKVQLQLIGVLAELDNSGEIATTTEDKIPDLFLQIRKNASNFEAPEELQQKLAYLLSDIFKKRHDIAKSAMLLGKTATNFEGLGYLESQELFDALLEWGSPADFDRAIQMIETPKTKLERWLASEPHRYHTALDYDEKTASLRPAKGAVVSWDTDKIREFKAMYYTRRDQLDSALLAIKNVPDTYWSQYDDREVYFKNNPFSCGVNLQGVPLSAQYLPEKFNKRSFLEKLIALRNATDPEKMQERYFLLGNAYYNMTYHGKDWWLMMKQGKSSSELSYYLEEGTGAVPAQESFPWDKLGWVTALGLVVTASSFRRNRKYGWLVLIFPVIVPFGCQSVGDKKPLTGPVTPFEEVYYRCTLAQSWYEKAAKINPDNDLGIAATYMLGHCERNRQIYDFCQINKNAYKPFVPKENPHFMGLKGKKFQSPLSCAELERLLY